MNKIHRRKYIITNKHMKWCSGLLAIRPMPKHSEIPLQTYENGKNHVPTGIWSNWNSHTLLWECRVMQPFWTIWKFFIKLKIHLYMHVFICVQLFCNPMDCSHPVPPSMEFSRQQYFLAILFSRGSSQSRDWTHISYIDRQILCHWATWGAQRYIYMTQKFHA